MRRRCDQVEAHTGTGPCLVAMQELHAVLIPRIDDGHEYPQWRQQAAHEGFVSGVAMPAYVAPGLSIALNLYSTQPDPWDAAALIEADTHAQRIAAAIQARVSASAQDAGSKLQEALSARTVIDQAVGAIMECNACTSQEALDVLLPSCVTGDVDLVQAARVMLHTLNGAPRTPAATSTTPPTPATDP